MNQANDDTAILTERPKTRKKDRQKPKPQPPWAVIVLNDDDHTYPYVIELFQKVFGYSLEKCFDLARTIDTQGRAIVWSGTREVAELKQEQIKNGGPDFYATKTVEYSLGVYIEQLPG